MKLRIKYDLKFTQVSDEFKSTSMKPNTSMYLQLFTSFGSEFYLTGLAAPPGYLGVVHPLRQPLRNDLDGERPCHVHQLEVRRAQNPRPLTHQVQLDVQQNLLLMVWKHKRKYYCLHHTEVCFCAGVSLNIHSFRHMPVRTEHYSLHIAFWYKTFFLMICRILMREETCCCHYMAYSFQLAAQNLLYAPSLREDSTYHGIC